MEKIRFKIFIIASLINSLIFVQVFPNLVRAGEKKKKIALIGIKFVDVPQQTRDIISWRMAAILELKDSFYLTRPDEARIVYGRNKMDELLTKQEVELYQQFAKQFGFAYVFSGKLTNQTPDSSQVFLVGELSRFDLATGELNHYEIHTAYDNFGNQLVAFKKQFVESVAIGQRTGRSAWSFVILGGLVVATVLSLRLALGNKSGESGTDPGTGGDN